MRRIILAALAAAAALAASCEDFLSEGKGTGTLSWQFAPPTKAGDFPDTNQFLLKVTDAAGTILYDGTYGDSPEMLSVREGSYTVSARSAEFSAPAFDLPVYGDTEVVLVKAGQTTRVTLACTMINSGIRLRISPEFIRSIPDGTLSLVSPDGRLPYPYHETRTAYFEPGIVSLQLTEGETTRTLLSRDLEPREILTVGLASPGSQSGATGADIGIAVDTAKVYHDLEYNPDDGTAGSEKDKALSIQQARASAGATGVWVYGYIVGGDLTSSGSKMNTGPVFSKDTHLAIAARSSVTEKASCLSVELKKADIRSALNLKDHPEMLGRQVFLKGDIVSAYYGIPGIKNVTDFSFE